MGAYIEKWTGLLLFWFGFFCVVLFHFLRTAEQEAVTSYKATEGGEPSSILEAFSQPMVYTRDNLETLHSNS